MDKETNQRHHGDQGTEVSHPYLAKQDSYTRDQPRSPVVAATAARNHDSSLTSETIPRIAAGRSVKSIVQWIEAAAQPSSPSTKSTIGDTSSHKEKAKSTNATAPTPPVQVTSPSRFGRAPIGADDEELSLAFLKYQEFFNDKPLLLRIKDVPDDICDISVDEMVRRAEQTNMSEKAKVVVDWSNYKVTDSSIKVPEQHLDLDLDKPCGKPAVIADINAAGHSDKSQKTLEKSHQVEVALAEKTSPDAPQLEQPFIQRDPDEVKKFWGQVRNYLWISDEELESSSDQDSDSPPMPKGVSTQPFTQKLVPSSSLAHETDAPLTWDGLQNQQADVSACGCHHSKLRMRRGNSPMFLQLPESVDELDEFFEQDEADAESKQAGNADPQESSFNLE